MNVRAQWMVLSLGLLISLLLGGAACSSTSEDDVSDSNRDGGDGDGDSNGDGDGDNGDGDGDSNGDGDGDGDGDTNGDGDGDGDSNGDGDGDEVEVLDAGNGILCGSTACPMGGCCADQFQSLCGAAIGVSGCIKPPEPDENSDQRCPEISIAGFFTLPSCCTPEGDCGINASMFSPTATCVEISEFEMRARMMLGDSGGALPFEIPEPKRCAE